MTAYKLTNVCGLYFNKTFIKLIDSTKHSWNRSAVFKWKITENTNIYGVFNKITYIFCQLYYQVFNDFPHLLMFFDSLFILIRYL